MLADCLIAGIGFEFCVDLLKRAAGNMKTPNSQPEEETQDEQFSVKNSNLSSIVFLLLILLGFKFRV